MGKILRISLKLNLTPNTLGCYEKTKQNSNNKKTKTKKCDFPKLEKIKF